MRTLTTRSTPRSLGQRCLSFKDRDKVLATNGVLFDTNEGVEELKGNEDLLFDQISRLERLVQYAVDKRISTKDSRYCFQKLKKYEAISQILTRRPGPDSARLRQQYDYFASQTELPSPVTETKIVIELLAILSYILPGRYFFTTNMGFCGIAVSKVRKNDSVTFLFGETIPTILRPRGLPYSMVCASYVSGIMNGELIDDMYENGGELSLFDKFYDNLVLQGLFRSACPVTLDVPL
jgi:hypothetical protein